MANVSIFSAAAKRLEGEIALITGGASGIGEYAAKIFTQNGAKVMIADIQDDLGHSVCKDLGSSVASYTHCNVTNESHVQNVVDSTMIQYGKLDIMFNNAGINCFPKPNILDKTLSEFEEVVKVNLIGPFLGTKHAARVMIPAKQGTIITMASTCSTIAGVAPHAYTSSKHGVLGLVRNTAVELGRLEGKVALITGGVSGIGEYTAKIFTQNGAKVMIADIQDDLGQEVCKEMGPSVASYIHCNVTNKAHVKNAVDSTVAQYGKLDIMLNNAGIAACYPKPILDNTQSEFEDVIKVNLVGPFLGIKHAARVMIPAQKGSIITTASTCSTIGGAAAHAYTSSKHGVVGLTRNTSVELGKYGIRVNCVSPHAVATSMTKTILNLDDDNVAKVYSNLKGTWCKKEDIAYAALFLASDESKYVSGHNLFVDGGFIIMNSGFCMFE